MGKKGSWFLVYSPFPVTLVFTLYLFIVALGPHLMRKWEPLRLKGLLTAYNLALVALSAYMFYEMCIERFFSQHQRAFPCLSQQMARVCWWFFFSKVIELLDTVFFILRKKTEQVTFLHVYHHGTMLFNWWAGVKYVPGGQAFFIGMLNSFVHIFMYSYYGLASLGPQMQRYLWWKRYLTILQLVGWHQFFVCLLSGLTYWNGHFPRCPTATDQGEVWVECYSRISQKTFNTHTSFLQTSLIPTKGRKETENFYTFVTLPTPIYKSVFSIAA
uniref:Elongation of very long chain fatty acids protein n=1 Tax=Pelusios castaneus TaxID=367368 RepID=A0A8C8S5B9_9SAUR